MKVDIQDFKTQVCGQVDDVKHEVLNLKDQHLALRAELQSHITETRTQHQQFSHQLESIKASSSSMPCTIPSPTISDEAIGKITEAIGDELHDRLKKISNQIQTVYRNVDENNLLTRKLQKKFQARTLSLKNALEKINQFMDEERHYEISGIVKETAILKGRIASTVEEFETLLSSFADNQTTYFQQLLDSISWLLDLMTMKHE